MYMNTTYSMKQSAVAMRKRMSDDTNKYNFNRKRVLDRIREGSIPQQKTTKIRHIERRGKRDTKRGESPTTRRRVRAVRVRANLSHQRGNQTHTRGVPRATTTHRKRERRRTETRPIVQKTYGKYKKGLQGLHQKYE